MVMVPESSSVALCDRLLVCSFVTVNVWLPTESVRSFVADVVGDIDIVKDDEASRVMVGFENEGVVLMLRSGVVVPSLRLTDGDAVMEGVKEALTSLESVVEGDCVTESENDREFQDTLTSADWLRE